VLESLAAFVAVSAVVICTPGQDTALTIRNTLAGGRRSGIATAAGVSMGQAIWTVAASAGVVALLSASEPAFRALKLAGAAYLVYLGAQSLSSALSRHGPATDSKQQSVAKSGDTPTPRPGHASDSKQQSVAESGAASAPRALRQGVISNLGNPKMAVFFASLLPQFVPGGRGSFLALLALGLLFCSLTFGWLTLYAVAVARVRRLIAGRVRRALDALTGIVLVLFGVRLATESR
jgi:threonine/homoserine/homoserine lactone efflux protein